MVSPPDKHTQSRGAAANSSVREVEGAESGVTNPQMADLAAGFHSNQAKAPTPIHFRPRHITSTELYCQWGFFLFSTGLMQNTDHRSL